MREPAFELEIVRDDDTTDLSFLDASKPLFWSPGFTLIIKRSGIPVFTMHGDSVTIAHPGVEALHELVAFANQWAKHMATEAKP